MILNVVFNVVRPSVLTLSVALACAAGAAHAIQAAPCSGNNSGMSSMADVTFAGMASNQCLVSDINPQQGPDGNASGFSHEFGSGFSLLGKVTSPAGSATSNGVNFDWTFDQTSGTTGTWSLMTDQEATFDVVFAMHAGGYGGAFLFDDQSTVASVLYANTWEINWLDNGSQVLDHSNLTLYVRNVDTVTPIPEPSTYALMLASLGVVGWVARRRRAAQYFHQVCKPSNKGWR